MFLNAYYRLIAYAPMLTVRCMQAATTHVSMSIPQLFDCSGTILNTITGQKNSYGDVPFTSPFSPPYPGIKSQTSKFTQAQTTSYPYSNIVIGTGTTPPVATDYRIENEVSTNLTYIALKTYVDPEKGTITYDKTMKYTGTDTLTITELGLTWPVYFTSASSYNAQQILVYRELLENPLVVQSGETFTVSITHQFTMPTD